MATINGSLLGKIASIFTFKSNRSNDINILNDTGLTTRWNNDRQAHADALTAETTNIVAGTRTKIKDLFWETPIQWAKGGLGLLVDLVTKVPAKLGIYTKGKIEAIPKLAASGALVALTEGLEKFDAPFKVLLNTNREIHKTLGTKSIFGNGAAANDDQMQERKAA